MRILKILFINIAIFLIGFSFLELFLRSYLTMKHYKNPYSNYWNKTWFRQSPANYITFDKELKFKTKSNLSLKNVDLPRWEKNSDITINSLGFRDNRNNIKQKKNERILLVGDSITFGSQVTDENTWSSCLEKKINIKTDNAGVPGYSAGQAVKRGEIESQLREYSHIIWSIYFRDFRRDINQKIIIKKNNLIKYNSPFQKNKTIENFNFLTKSYFFLKEYLFIIYYLDEKIFKIDFNKTTQEIDKKINISEDNMLKEITKFLIEMFSKVPVKNKIILLQYLYIQPNDTKENNPELYDIELLRELVLEFAKKYKIEVYDTNDVIKIFNEQEKKLLYFDHHTKIGNQMICDFISSKL
jgi:hypothetical protein